MVTWIRKYLLSAKNLPVILFCALASIIGVLFIHNIGPLAGPDMNDMHYRSSLSIATGQIFTKVDKIKNKQMIKGAERWVKSGTVCGTRNDLVSNLIQQPLKSDNMHKCQKLSDLTLSETKVVEAGARTQYPLFGWLPQATGIFIGKSTGMQPADAQNTGRIFNLLTYIVIMSLAIAIIPRAKWLIAVFGLLPASLFLASSLSSDALNIAWATLFIAYVFRLYEQRSKISKKQTALVFILGMGFFVLKVAYAPLILMLLALKKPVIATKRKIILLTSIAVLGAAIYLVWNSHWSVLSSIVDVQTNKQFIIDHVIKAAIGVFANILYIFYLPYSLAQTTRENAYIAIAIIAVVIMYFYGKVFEKPKNIAGVWQHYGIVIMSIVAATVSLALTYAALMLTWTDTREVGFMEIDGFQGRYVLPLLPLVASIFFVVKEKRKSK